MPTAEEFRQFNQSIIDEFRENAGKVSGWSVLLLLNTIGAKSGKPHTTPLVYSVDDKRIIVVAAAAGSERHPAWYYNILAHPVVTVELNGENHRMRAVIAEGKEYKRYFPEESSTSDSDVVTH